MPRVVRGRFIGQDDSGTEIDFDIDVQKIVGTAMDVYETAKKAYDAANQILELVQAKEEKQWKALQAGTETYVSVLSNAVGMPYLGALFNAWFSQQRGAAAGPGVCATNPPSSPDYPTLKSWAYFHPWGYPSGSSYNSGKPGSFEAYANPILEYNAALVNNCFVAQAQIKSVLLAHLIAAWNATHAGPLGPHPQPGPWHEVARTGINPNCTVRTNGSSRYFDCSNVPINVWDPIADALEESFAEKYPPRPGTSDFAISSLAPMNVTMSFAVNDGQPIAQPAVKTAHLLLVHHPSLTPSTAVAKPIARASSAAPVLVAGGIAAAGALAVHTFGWPAFARRLFR